MNVTMQEKLDIFRMCNVVQPQTKKITIIIIMIMTVRCHSLASAVQMSL